MSNSQFRLISGSNFLKFYRTPTDFSTNLLNPSISVINEIPFVLIPQTNSYTIYNLQNLTLQFSSCELPEIDDILQSGVFVYILSGNRIIKTYRGEIVLDFFLGNFQSKGFFTKFGSYLVVSYSNEAVVLECVEEDEHSGFNILHKLKFDSEIKFMIHPNTYINKLLFVFDKSAQLFNLNKNASLFDFKFNSRITALAQTSVSDVFGFAYENGIIELINIRKNKPIYSIEYFKNKNISKLQFLDKYLLVCIGNMVVLFDLEIKNEVFNEENTHSGLLMSLDNILLISSCSIKIINTSDFKTLKARRILNKDIKRIRNYSDSEILAISGNSLFKFNINRDEMNAFLKTNHRTLISFDSQDTGNILVNSSTGLFFIDKIGKYRNFLNLKSHFVKVFTDFCMAVIKKTNYFSIFILNLKSKRIVIKIKTQEFISGDMDNNIITVLSNKGITQYDYNGNIQHQFIFQNNIGNCHLINYPICESNDFAFRTFIIEGINIPDGSEITKYGNLIFIRSKLGIYVISDKNCRLFIGNGYSLDPTHKIMTTTHGNSVYIYDIVSGTLLETVETNKELIDISIVSNGESFKFVALLDSDSHIHLLSNLSHFNSMKYSIIETSLIKNTKETVKIVKKDTSFYKDMIIFQETQNLKSANVVDSDLIIKSLSASQVSQLVVLIKRNLADNFIETQKILNKLLKFKGRFIDIKDLEEIQSIVDSHVEEYENKVLVAIGYLKLENSGLI